ncbi:MAG: hypothetical protein ACTS8H_00915 [Arsenophonus sp. NC-PE1-MAG3]
MAIGDVEIKVTKVRNFQLATAYSLNLIVASPYLKSAKVAKSCYHGLCIRISHKALPIDSSGTYIGASQ